MLTEKLRQALLDAMGYETVMVSCEHCVYWKVFNEKSGWASLCTYNSIGYIEVFSQARCKKFKRKV